MVGGAVEGGFSLLILHFAFLGFKGSFLRQPAQLANLSAMKFFVHPLDISDFITFQKGPPLT